MALARMFLSVVLAIALVIELSLICLAPAVAQTPPPGKPDAVDALAAWRRLQVSRAAVRDQLELCDDDGARFQQVSRELRPDGGAGPGEWKDWAALVRDTGHELESCLRAYNKQIGLLRADHNALAAMLPAVQQAKPMSLGPKQLAEVTGAVEESQREIALADAHVGALADQADKAALDALRLLRQKGIAKLEPPLPSFKKLL